MSLLAITRPETMVANLDASTAGGQGHANLLTPNPREAFVGAVTAQQSIVFNMPVATPLDTFFLGFTNAPADATFQVVASGPGWGGLVWQGPVAHSYRRSPMRHAFAVLAQPTMPAVAISLVISAPAAFSLVAGVAAAGLALRPNGYEWGSGRSVSDSTRVERLQDGGFGIDPGATAGGWAWTMPGLSDEMRERLYALQLDVGIGNTLLVLEDPDAGPGANERAHWSLLTKLEPYARQAPDEAKWAMQVQDWS